MSNLSVYVCEQLHSIGVEPISSHESVSDAEAVFSAQLESLLMETTTSDVDLGEMYWYVVTADALRPFSSIAEVFHACVVRRSFSGPHYLVGVRPSAMFSVHSKEPFALATSTCSRAFFGTSDGVVQPMFQWERDTSAKFCVACGTNCCAALSGGQPAGFSMEGNSRMFRSASSEKFTCSCPVDRCLFKQPIESRSQLAKGNYGLFLRDCLGVVLAQAVLKGRELSTRQMESRLETYAQQVFEYESKDTHAMYLGKMPLSKWRTAGTKMELLEDMMKWFKHEFFSWVNSPACSSCGKGTSLSGVCEPSQEELYYKAGRVELHRCADCGTVTRFPRFNSAVKLCQTRCGRCGEWAQAFTACCRALGYPARFVMDFTDHVWTEVYLEDEQRWIHTDCCEDIRDAPLVYESGWGKKLSYIFSFSVEEVRDVTKRYTRRYSEVLSRRTMMPEDDLERLVEKLNLSRPKRTQQTLERWNQEWQSILQAEEANLRLLKDEEQKSRISGNE
eukprot:ANDGO_01032.mRNA.1 Peptide-N(4)-(N-acetyl-beta- glucosaminyl)asparagine amidase